MIAIVILITTWVTLGFFWYGFARESELFHPDDNLIFAVLWPLSITMMVVAKVMSPFLRLGEVIGRKKRK